MEIAKLTTQSELRILKNTLLGPDDKRPNLEIPESNFKKYMQQRIMILIGGEKRAKPEMEKRLDVITFKLDNILNEIIVFFNGIQILKEYEEISELLEQLNDYKKIISDFKNNTSSLIRQMPYKSNDLSTKLNDWIENRNYIKKLKWDSYKKAKPVLEKVEQLREKYGGFGEYYALLVSDLMPQPVEIYSDSEVHDLELSFKATFKKAIDDLYTPTLDLEDTKKLLENETTKINNQITQMVDFIKKKENKQYAQKLRYLTNLQTLRNKDTGQTLDFLKLLDRKEDIKREIEEAKIIEIKDANTEQQPKDIPESLDENNPELAQKISVGSKILEQLAIKFSYKINNDEINTDKINKINKIHEEDTAVNEVYTALKIEDAGNIFSEKEKKECKTHIRNMVKSVNNRFDEEQVN